MSEPGTDHTVVSAEDSQGRVLSGVGVEVEQLEQALERHDPDVTAAPEPAAEPPTATPEAPKEPRGRQRFSKLTSELEETRKERDALKAQYEAALANSRSAATRPTDDTGNATGIQRGVEVLGRTDQSGASARPSEPDFEKEYEAQIGPQGKYQTYGAAVQAFNRDYAKWSRTDLDARIHSHLEMDRARASREADLTARGDRGRQAYPDYLAVINTPHMQSGWSEMHLAMFDQQPNIEQLLYAVGKNPTLATTLKSISNPVTLAMEIARLAPAPAVASPASTAGAGSSTPPPPYQPVGGGSKTTAPPLDDLVKRGGHDFDKSGYREKRAEQLGRNRRR